MTPGDDGLVEHFRLMARNNRWSNRRLLAACVAAGSAEFDLPRVSFFPSLRETLTHLYRVDQYYLDALEEGGRGPAAYALARPISGPDELAHAQDLSDLRLIACCDTLSPAALYRSVPTDRGDEGVFFERVSALLAHLFLHQIHHRGQAHAMLSGTSIAPPQLDEFLLEYDRGRAPPGAYAD